LQGSRVATQLVPGTPDFIQTLLDSPKYTNVTGGQRVENIKQSGDVVVMISGRGTRSTVVQTVRTSFENIWVEIWFMSPAARYCLLSDLAD
jgi:hypothetical protein